jgi:proteasome lid subunit RPN8/RPN11
MMMVRREVLDEAVEHLRRCGAGRKECVVYLTGPADMPSLIDGVIHPAHTASTGHYEVDGAAIGRLWDELHSSRRSVRAQVHTHPGAAYHSERDDGEALISTPGYISLVLANFALGTTPLAGAHLAVRLQDGSWGSAPVSSRLAVTA